MVSVDVLISMFITLGICFLFPVLLYILLRRKSKNITGAVVAGGIAFFVSQMLIRLPLIQVVFPKFDWFVKLGDNPYLYILFFALTAALFEETARYLAYITLLKEKLVYKSGIAFGIGHGGIESIMLLGLTYVNNIIISFMINSGKLTEILGKQYAPDMLKNIENSLTQTPASTFLAAGFERMFVIMVHIGLSVLILEGIVRKKSLVFYLGAIIFHSGLNYISSFMAYKGVNLWVVELIILLFAIISIIYILNAKKRFKDNMEALDEGKKALEEGY